MGIGKVLDIFFMPPGLGGLGIGKGPFQRLGEKGKGGDGGGQGPAPLPLPQAPSPQAAAEKAEETIRRKKAAISRSIYTSPLGVAGEANVARKTLLGQ